MKKRKRWVTLLLAAAMYFSMLPVQAVMATELEGAVERQGYAPSEDYGYLMVHFIEDPGGYAEKIYLDISRGDNPEQWDPLNGGQPILTSNLGTTGVRDPFITCNPETGTYYIIATDLRVFGGDNAGWGGWQQNYSTKMNVWESEDLISWSRGRQFDVALDQAGKKQANMGMMWAPEATWVPDYYGDGNGAFVVYWSSQCYTDEAQTQRDSGSKIMWGVTKDFTQETWEFGGVFLDGGEHGWIDTTIIQNGDKTYHITKSNDEQIIMESTTDKEWWKLGANWTRIQSRIGEDRFGAVEGPAVFKDHSRDDRWYLFVDDLPSPGYQPMISTDLDKGWDYLDSKDYFLTEFTKHGGVISLTKNQYDAIRNADAASVAEELPTLQIAAGASADDVLAKLPSTVKVNKAYGLGTTELPVVWDVSRVKTETAGKYTVSGIVNKTIGANKNQWKGKQGSTDYLAENKKLYSSTELKVSVPVRVSSKTDPDGADKSILESIVDKAEKLDEGRYSTESWEKLQTVLAQVQQTAQKPGVTQVEIEAAEEALEAAIAALQPRSIMAFFDFNKNAENSTFTSGQAVAKVNGTVQLQDRDEQNGKSLYLDGSASYLDIKKSDGSSLLTGLEEITVCFDAKPDRTDTNWGFYAAPNTNAPIYGQERYIGALINNGTTTIERYHNDGVRPKNASVSTGTGWSHIDVVLMRDRTVIYVNGQKKESVESGYSLTDILGGSSIFQIGKANWGNSGEYYKGWIDNFAVYGEALKDSELLDTEIAETFVREDLEDVQFASQIKVDFELPETGNNMTDISWKLKSASPYLKIQANRVSVTRPKWGDADAQATLVGTAKMGNAECSKEFTLTIPAFSKEEMVEGIVIPKYITGNLQSEHNGSAITWSCDKKGIVGKDGKVTLPKSGQGNQKVKLTAKVGKDLSITGEAEVLEYGGSILTYVLKDTDLLAYKDSRRTDALFAAAKNEKTGNYESLNKGKAILYVKWDGDQKVKQDKQMGSPSLFRKADGSLGVIASANNNEEGVYLWDAKDQVNFTNERYLKLNDRGIKVQNPVMLYDSASRKYKVFWNGDNGVAYLTVLENLSDTASVGNTIPCTYQRKGIQAKGLDNADLSQASEFVMSPAEYKAFVRKYAALHNIGIKKVDISIKPGQKAVLPKTVKAEYSDGSNKSLGVIWNQADLNKLDTSKEGTYTIRGEVQQDAYAYPFIEERADPHIFYNEDDGYYYSTGSYYEAGMTSNNVEQSYRKLDIRRAKTIKGLKTAEEHFIMESKVGDRWGGFFWAPEFHKINGTWYCLVGAHDFGVSGITDATNWNQSNWCSNSILIPYIGDGDSSTSIEEDIKAGGMLQASQWGEPVIMEFPSGAEAAFDVSYYQAEDGQGYYIIPKSANLLIVKAKGGEGIVPQPEGEAVKLKGLQWPWEYGVEEGSVNAGNPEGNDQGIVEGPYLFEYGEKVYISYSGATVDKYYCLGLMMADKGSNLMDPANWTQVPYPVLSSYDTHEGKVGGAAHIGGGHNSVVLDEYGNLALIYHARPYPEPHEGMSGAGGLFDPCRNTVVKSVNVAYDGTLVFNMTAEEELDPKYKSITATVKVSVGVSKVKLNKTKLTLGVKDQFTLKATVTPKNATNKKVTWKSSNSKVAAVTSKGVVKAKKKGKVTITAKAGGKTAMCKVTVKAAPRKITLNAKRKTLKKGKSFQIKVKKTPKNSVCNKITYKTSNKKIATVSKSGKVKAKKAGKATITVTSCNGKKAKIVIIVKK